METPTTASGTMSLPDEILELSESIARGEPGQRPWRYEPGTGYVASRAGRGRLGRRPSVAEATKIVRRIAALAAKGDLREYRWELQGPRGRIRLEGCCPITAGVRSTPLETLRRRIRTDAGDLDEAARKRLQTLEHGPLALEAHFDPAGLGARLLDIDEEEASVIAAASDGEAGPLRDRMIRILKVAGSSRRATRRGAAATSADTPGNTP